MGGPELVILALPLFFAIRGVSRIWKGVTPRPLDPGAPEFIQRVWKLTPWLDVIWGVGGFLLLLIAILSR